LGVVGGGVGVPGGPPPSADAPAGPCEDEPQPDPHLAESV
jgi:hypothetical protein